MPFQSRRLPTPTGSLESTQVGSGEVSTKRLIGSFVSALVVVLANVAVVIHVVAEASATSPGQSARVEPGAAYSLPAPSPTGPSTPIVDAPEPTTVPSTAASVPPASTSSVPSTVIEPVMTEPPRSTSPSTSSPAPPAPTPSRSFAQRLEPATALPDPVSNIAPNPNFLASCGFTAYNGSFSCVWEVVSAIDNARSSEGLPPMVLPTNWASLTPAEQLFVATNLERSVRGLAPLSAMAPALDAAAAQGAAADADPRVPPGFPWTSVGGNWAGPVGNPLEAMYYWMYDDGLGSTNIDCSLSNVSACWGHRQNLLLPLASGLFVMGGAWGTTPQGATSVTELIVGTRGPVITDFRWAQEQPYFP